MRNYYFVLNLIVSALFTNGQLLPDVPPEKINFVNYSSLYTKELGKCIITNNTKPAPGLLLNRPYLVSCNKYKADFLSIQLPANTYPMCSLDPNWVFSNLPSYSLASSYWYPIDTGIFDKEITKCINELKSLDTSNIVDKMYGLDAKHAFCKRHIEFNLKIFGGTTEIKDIKKKIVNKLNTDFPNRSINQLLSEFIITSTCVGTNLDGCVKMWERLLIEKDNCILNTLGYKIDKTSSTWLYADGLDIQLTHIWSNIMNLGIEKSEYKGFTNYRIVDKSPNTNDTFFAPGIIG